MANASPAPKASSTDAGTKSATVNRGGWKVCLAFTLLILVMFFAGRLASTMAAWVITAVSMVIFVVILGSCINHHPLGILVNEQNVMSLSRFQLVVWTIIVLSAFITIALKRIFAGVADPLEIALPWQLWALMGISTTSLIGSPLIKAGKADRDLPSEMRKDIETRALLRAGTEKLERAHQGRLFARHDPKDASCPDMFRGDEFGNAGTIDIAKLQMFYFTIVCALAYVAVLGNWMLRKQPAEFAEFPALADGLIALLGISHTGYLSSKGIDYTARS